MAIRTRFQRKSAGSGNRINKCGGFMESLENRNLMAADAFALDAEELQAQIHADVVAHASDVVFETSSRITRQLNDESFGRSALNNKSMNSGLTDAAMLVFGDETNQDDFSTIDLFDHVRIDGLDHVEILDVIEILNHVQLSTELPPEFEQLRLKLGDEQFVELLETNAFEFGNLSGVPDDVVHEWEQFNSMAVQQFHASEGALNDWLNGYLESTDHTEDPYDEPHDGPHDFPSVDIPLLEGDFDGDGTVSFADFVVLSTNYGQDVEAGRNGDIDGDGSVSFVDFVTLSNNFGESLSTCSSSGGDITDDPEDGTEIQDAGDLKIRDGSVVFISDRTVGGDKEDLGKDAPKGTPIHEGMKSWADVIKELEKLSDGSITGDFVISGHGADGGVGASGSDIDGENLTQEQADVIKKKLGPNARIVVLGCGQADAEDNDHMQRMADMTDRSVVGNQGDVSDGTNGDDDWFRFDPSK